MLIFMFVGQLVDVLSQLYYLSYAKNNNNKK